MKMKAEHYRVLRDAIEHTFERMRSAEAPHMLAAQSYRDPELSESVSAGKYCTTPGYRATGTFRSGSAQNSTLI